MMDSPWDLEETDYNNIRDAEWSKISSDFTNAGYREGITAGKEAALQEGFDAGFASVGAPIGRELGRLRGITSAVISFHSSSSSSSSSTAQEIRMEHLESDRRINEARDIYAQLGRFRLGDIAPRDLEAEEHARQHLEFDDLGLDDDPTGKRKMEQVEDMLEQLTAGVGTKSGSVRPTIDDLQVLRGRLDNLCREMGLAVNCS